MKMIVGGRLGGGVGGCKVNSRCFAMEEGEGMFHEGRLYHMIICRTPPL